MITVILLFFLPFGGQTCLYLGSIENWGLGHHWDSAFHLKRKWFHRRDFGLVLMQTWWSWVFVHSDPHLINFVQKKLNQSIFYQRLSDKTENFMKTHNFLLHITITVSDLSYVNSDFLFFKFFFSFFVQEKTEKLWWSCV